MPSMSCTRIVISALVGGPARLGWEQRRYIWRVDARGRGSSQAA